MTTPTTETLPGAGGSGKYPLLPAYYGEFGGQYVAEGLLPALDQLEQAFVDAMADEDFMREYRGLLRDYLGRPTPLTECRNLPLDGAHARIFLKREDLVHGGAHRAPGVGDDDDARPPVVRVRLTGDVPLALEGVDDVGHRPRCDAKGVGQVAQPRRLRAVRRHAQGAGLVG